MENYDIHYDDTYGRLGPLFYRRWFSRGSLEAEFVKTVVKSVAESDT